MCFQKAIKGVKTHACTSNFTQYSKKNDHVLFTYESNNSKHEINCLSKIFLCQFCHKMGISTLCFKRWITFFIKQQSSFYSLRYNFAGLICLCQI